MSRTPTGTPGNTWDVEVDDAGAFRRSPTAYHAMIGQDSAWPAAAGRYHLYVSLACPWAHRTLIARAIKGLADHITVDVVDHFLDDHGWSLTASTPGATPDSVFGETRLRGVYTRTDSDYAGRITVPVLLDKQTGRIVNNESSEIIRMLNDAFQDWAEHPEIDLYPEPLRDRIDEVNGWVYPQINNGVYKCGFAKSQAAYDRAAVALFEGLDRAEAILAESRFLAGHRVTEADIRLVTTLFRFDVVYHTHFKCNLRRLIDYPNLWAYTRDMYQLPGVAETVDLEHIKRHYFASHTSVNPYRIVPLGPEAPAFDAPHGRETLGDGALYWTR
ncbi:MAG: putative glutathione S-transferase [Myxococcota bacterium]|jgi:putative glutathione S-transferase